MPNSLKEKDSKPYLMAERVARARRTVSPKNMTAFSRTQMLCIGCNIDQVRRRKSCMLNAVACCTNRECKQCTMCQPRTVIWLLVTINNSPQSMNRTDFRLQQQTKASHKAAEEWSLETRGTWDSKLRTKTQDSPCSTEMHGHKPHLWRSMDTGFPWFQWFPELGDDTYKYQNMRKSSDPFYG